MLFLPYSVYSAQNNELLIYKDIESKIYLRSWGSKGFGQFLGKEQITVIKPNNESSNVVVLKWNEAHDNFQTEIYVSQEIDDILSSWTLLSRHNKKILTHQHDHYYKITETISGKNGGVRYQKFNLPLTNDSD